MKTSAKSRRASEGHVAGLEQHLMRTKKGSLAAAKLHVDLALALYANNSFEPAFEHFIAAFTGSFGRECIRIQGALECFGRAAWILARCPDGLRITEKICKGGRKIGVHALLAHAHLLTSLGRPGEAIGILDLCECSDESIPLDAVVSLAQERAYAIARMGDEKEGLASFRRAAEFVRHRSNRELIAVTLNNFAVAARNAGQTGIAVQLHQEVLGILHNVSSQWRKGYCLASHSLTSYFAGDVQGARAILEESLKAPCPMQVRLAQHAVGLLVAVCTGNALMASKFASEEILEISFRSGEPYRFAAMSAAMHQYYRHQGYVERAHSLLERCMRTIVSPEGCSLIFLEVVKHGSAPVLERAIALNDRLSVTSRVRDAFLRLLRARILSEGGRNDGLPEADRAAAVFADLRWPLHQAVALECAQRYGEASEIYRTCGAPLRARQLRQQRGKVGRPRRFAGQLTARQLEIAKLCRTGLRNHEIARRMGLTVGTVEFHVHNILRELNITSRHELRDLL